MACPRPGQVGLLALVVGASLHLYGCGGGPIREHARGVVIASSALTVAEATILSARSAELDACEDEPCLDAGEERWAPVMVGYNLAVDAVESWQGALELALQVGAEAQPDLVNALFSVASLFVAAYGRMRSSLAPLHLELPPLVMPWGN